MAITPPPIIDIPPTAPSTNSPSTFDALADAFVAHWNAFRNQIVAALSWLQTMATAAETAATNAEASESAAALSETNAAASATAAASAAGAAAWAAGTYALNACAISQINYQTYRKITASSMTTVDPANDPTNWTPLGGLLTVNVTGTTHTAAAGACAILENVAATAVAAPAAVDGVEFKVIAANGLKTNTVDFGAKTLQGPNSSASGVITLDTGLPLHARFFSSVDKWVML